MTPCTSPCRNVTDSLAADATARRTPAEIRQMLREIAFVLNMTRRVRQEMYVARQPLSVASPVTDADHPPRPELLVGG